MIAVSEEVECIIAKQRDVVTLLEPYYGRVIKLERLYSDEGILTSELRIGRIEYLSHTGTASTARLKARGLSEIRLSGWNEKIWVWPTQSRISLLQEDSGQWKTLYQGKDWADTHPEDSKKDSV